MAVFALSAPTGASNDCGVTIAVIVSPSILNAAERESVEQLRSAAFRMQRSGYREEQVDALLDATIDVILAVR